MGQQCCREEQQAEVAYEHGDGKAQEQPALAQAMECVPTSAGAAHQMAELAAAASKDDEAESEWLGADDVVTWEGTATEPGAREHTGTASGGWAPPADAGLCDAGAELAGARPCDGVGVPWVHARSGAEQHFLGLRCERFIHAFYATKALSESGTGYVLKLEGGKADYSLRLAAAAREAYPPPTYDRRLTLNNHRVRLTETLLLAGLRLATLQANVQTMLAIWDNPAFGNVPRSARLLWMAMFAVGVTTWAALSAASAYKYRHFAHDDTPLRQLVALASATLLIMFDVPNDIVLCPFHAYPLASGGLLCEAGSIEGNWHWPVLTIAHSSKEDHDFTNHAALTVQLPVFLLVDLGCTAVCVALLAQYGAMSFSVLIHMCLSCAYALLKLCEVVRHRRLRPKVLAIWRRTACDPHMSAGRQAAAISKYRAEGGSIALLRRELEQQELERERRELERAAERPAGAGAGAPPRRASLQSARRASMQSGRSLGALSQLSSRVLDAPRARASREAALAMVQELDLPPEEQRWAPRGCSASEADGLGVPWYRPRPVFQGRYLMQKERAPGGGYAPRLDAGGTVEHSFALAPGGREAYPPPAFMRRVTLSSWQGMLAAWMLEAGFRCAGLQANLMTAVLMLESPVYRAAPLGARALFFALLAAGLLLWACAGFLDAWSHRVFIHPDTRWELCRAFGASALLLMLTTPNDIALFPMHMLPLSKGGLLWESGCVLGLPQWPAHTVSHQSKLDHDYVNTEAIINQLPLFLLMDIGCTVTNIWISGKVGVFNYTSLLQMCTCGAYAFVKLYEIFVRLRLRRRLLPIWRKTISDPQMPYARRMAAHHKYCSSWGSSFELEEECVAGTGEQLNCIDRASRAVDPH